MRGLLIAGTTHDAGELPVATAAIARAREAGMAAEPFVASAAGPSARDAAALLGAGSERVFETGAPPAVAARHAGAQVDPATLAAAASAAADGADVLVAATSGGLLAPLAERYLNRDLARELRLPIVLAAPAAAGLVNSALLALEAARGAALAVAAIAISGWPEQPGRVLLDERALLERAVGVPVVTVPSAARSLEAFAAAAHDWPLADWLDAAPAQAAPGDGQAEPAARVTLDPYDEWEARPVGDPRGTARAEIMSAMLEIVGAEGPMRASRAYALYNRASGGRKLTSVARAPLSSAIYWLAQERRVVLTRREEIPWQDDDVVRLPDTPAVRVRELGPRTLEEVPLDEIAELTGRIRAARGVSAPMELKRAILSTYGLVRLTGRADEYLGLALDLAGVA